MMSTTQRIGAAGLVAAGVMTGGLAGGAAEAASVTVTRLIDDSQLGGLGDNPETQANDFVSDPFRDEESGNNGLVELIDLSVGLPAAAEVIPAGAAIESITVRLESNLRYMAEFVGGGGFASFNDQGTFAFDLAAFLNGVQTVEPIEVFSPFDIDLQFESDFPVVSGEATFAAIFPTLDAADIDFNAPLAVQLGTARLAFQDVKTSGRTDNIVNFGSASFPIEVTATYNFTSPNVIPTPSAAAAGLIGLGGLLTRHRRRI